MVLPKQQRRKSSFMASIMMNNNHQHHHHRFKQQYSSNYNHEVLTASMLSVAVLIAGAMIAGTIYFVQAPFAPGVGVGVGVPTTATTTTSISSSSFRNLKSSSNQILSDQEEIIIQQQQQQQQEDKTRTIQINDNKIVDYNSNNNNEMEMLTIWEELLETVTMEKLHQIADDSNKKQTYANGYPFPHIVIDDLFPNRILQKLLDENPESLVNENTGCLQGKVACTKHSIIGQDKKSAINDERQMGPYTRMVLGGFLKSSIWVTFLKELTNIHGLIPDPQFEGSGIHFTAPGGKLNIHADFNSYTGPKLERRVNMFLFLNPDWNSDEYGGHLELWSRDKRKCGQKIAPILGRIVIFSTTDFSYHGHPHPLTCPPGRARRSIAMYYYTNGRPKHECESEICGFMRNFQSHGTLWQTTACADCEDPECNALEEGKRRN